MPWPVASQKNSHLGLVVAGLLVGVFIALFPADATRAAESQIGVSVCGSNAPAAQIDITQPLSDSVVGQASVTFRGTVANAAQIEIEINGDYSGTFALPANSSTFERVVILPVGTNTVSMTANAICGGQEAIDSTVVTYQPATEPTSGEATPTSLDGSVTLDGSPAPTEPIDQNSIAQVIGRLPVIGSAVSVVSDFATAVGLEATVTANNSTAVAGTARVALTVAALSSIVMASTIAPAAAQALPGLSELFDTQSHRSMMYLGWAIRGAGVLALALAYLV